MNMSKRLIPSTSDFTNERRTSNAASTSEGSPLPTWVTTAPTISCSGSEEWWGGEGRGREGEGRGGEVRGEGRGGGRGRMIGERMAGEGRGCTILEDGNTLALCSLNNSPV